MSDIINILKELEKLYRKLDVVSAPQPDTTKRMLAHLIAQNDAEIKRKMASRPYKVEFNALYGVVTHIKGLKDMRPDGISEDQWYQLLEQVSAKLTEFEQSLDLKKGFICRHNH